MEFDDFPPMSGWTWRQVTRWISRNGFEPVKPQQILRTEYRNYTDAFGGSAIWFRHRPNLRTEAVRVDILGHQPQGHSDATVVHRFATERVGFGEPRHMHKESIPGADERAYLQAPVPSVIRYSDLNVPLPGGFPGHLEAHIRLNP
jgi:hypothetical protein